MDPPQVTDVCLLEPRFSCSLNSNCAEMFMHSLGTVAAGRWWQYGPPFPPSCLPPPLPSLPLSPLSSLPLSSRSRIVYNFVRCYRKHYRMILSGKQLLWNIRPVIQNSMLLKKMYLLWTVMLEGSRAVLIGQKVHNCSSVTHQECRAFFYRERAFIQV